MFGAFCWAISGILSSCLGIWGRSEGPLAAMLAPCTGHLGDVSEPLIGVWGVVLRRVGLFGKRRGDVFAYLSGFLQNFFRFSCGLEACWMRFGGILEALSKHFGGVLERRQSVFLILEAILQSVAIFDTFS